MYAPFKRRATEYLGDGERFLADVTPDFFETLLEPYTHGGRLSERLVRIVGSPGSGKTTLAKLVQYENAAIVARRPRDHKDVHRFLEAIGIVAFREPLPKMLACRLPMESDYRDFWELPYGDLNNQLLLAFIQARIVISWYRQIERAEIDLDDVSIIPSESSPALLSEAGVGSAADFYERALSVEEAIYRIVAALVPPSSADELPDRAVRPYAPFWAIRSFKIRGVDVRPLLVLDDFHFLHSEQRRAVYRAFTRRELKIARWTMLRFDALTPKSAIAAGKADDDELPSDVSRQREVTNIFIQEDARLARQFRSAAPKMANQKLLQIPAFASSQIASFGPALSVAAPRADADVVRRLHEENLAFIEQRKISERRYRSLEGKLSDLVPQSEADVRERALSILLHRYANRVRQVALLEEWDPDPSRPLAINEELADGARVQLLHQFERPYYFGIDKLIDAANANAERFLRLCSPLIDALETQLMSRTSGKVLPSHVQHEKLSNLAEEDRDDWSFPESRAVRRLTDFIGNACVKRTLEDTAPQGAGPNAIGIERAEFENLFSDIDQYRRLAHVLKYAIAYNAMTLTESAAKGKDWVLIGLSGMLCIYHKLSFRKSNFIDYIRLDEVAEAVESV